MAERRTNLAHRQQANAWFDALRAHMSASTGQSDILDRLNSWEKIENVLADCPALLPGLLTMAWQLRHTEGFTELFKTVSGQSAESTSDKLQPFGKSFDEILLANLQGAMRVFCQQQESGWLASEKKRKQPPKITTWPLVGGLMLRILKLREEDILRQYPHHGLYPVLKPWLRKREQFALIGDLAALPTGHARILGDAILGLSNGASIRNLAALETRKLKFLVQLARHIATRSLASDDSAHANQSTQAAAKTALPQGSAGEIAGAGLTRLTVDGLHLAKGAIAVREQAMDIIDKLLVPMGYDLWSVFANPEAAANVALCPTSLARAIGAHATQVPRKTAEALRSLPGETTTEMVVSALLAIAGHEVLAAWATSEGCVSAWQRIALEVKQATAKMGENAVTGEMLTRLAQSLAPTFASLSGVAQPAVEDTPVQAPVALSSGGGSPGFVQSHLK